jgi:hypothetical protein
MRVFQGDASWETRELASSGIVVINLVLTAADKGEKGLTRSSTVLNAQKNMRAKNASQENIIVVGRSILRRADQRIILPYIWRFKHLSP